MMFAPDKLEVKKGEQIRFMPCNSGALEHEFIFATAAENAKHAEQMRRTPTWSTTISTASKRLKPKEIAEIVWRFTKAGECQFGCLIPGHSEAGMVGMVVVK